MKGWKMKGWMLLFVFCCFSASVMASECLLFNGSSNSKWMSSQELAGVTGLINEKLLKQKKSEIVVNSYRVSVSSGCGSMLLEIKQKVDMNERGKIMDEEYNRDSTELIPLPLSRHWFVMEDKATTKTIYCTKYDLPIYGVGDDKVCYGGVNKIDEIKRILTQLLK